MSFLTAEHQEKIAKAYQAFADDPGFAAIASTAEILAKDGNLSIPRYVKEAAASTRDGIEGDLRSSWATVEATGRAFWQQMDALVAMLEAVAAEEAADA